MRLSSQKPYFLTLKVIRMLSECNFGHDNIIVRVVTFPIL